VHKAARVAVLAVAVLSAQTPKPGPQALTLLSTLDDSVQPYALYLPLHFDPARRYPLVISLHDEASNHRLNLSRVFGITNRINQTSFGARRGYTRALPETDAQAANGPFQPFPNVDFIVAAPLARGTIGYQGIPEADVYDVLDDLKKKLPIDEDRVYLTGPSMGGGGALWLGLTRPDVWAAIAAVCPVPPPGTEELAGNALNVPVRLFQGALDPLVLPDSVRKLRDTFQEAGVRVEYTEYPAVKHNAWEYAYRDASIFNWFARYKRERFPELVRFSTRSYKHRSAYWVELDGLTPGALASIDARIAGPNQIEVKTTGIDGFTLHLDGCPKCVPANLASFTVDGVAIKAPLKATLSFSRIGAEWKAALYARPDGAKGPGREGPISEAVSGRHLYVYGTADGPDQAELARRRQQAERAANWQKPLIRVLVSMRAVTDAEVTDADLRTSNLVLFGSKATNLLIARMAGRLPLELNPSAADFGLLFVAPAGDRYVLVNSGVPWWTGAPQDALPFELLPAFGDFILFKRSLKDVVVEGRFDRNWKVPAEAAARLAAAGVVQMR
jgi:pimeloyl-ACP methyl ester carboxylesterase